MAVVIIFILNLMYTIIHETTNFRLFAHFNAFFEIQQFEFRLRVIMLKGLSHYDNCATDDCWAKVMTICYDSSVDIFKMLQCLLRGLENWKKNILKQTFK